MAQVGTLPQSAGSMSYATIVRARFRLNLRERQGRTRASTTEVPGAKLGLPQSSAVFGRSPTPHWYARLSTHCARSEMRTMITRWASTTNADVGRRQVPLS